MRDSKVGTPLVPPHFYLQLKLAGKEGKKEGRKKGEKKEDDDKMRSKVGTTIIRQTWGQ